MLKFSLIFLLILPPLLTPAAAQTPPRLLPFAAETVNLDAVTPRFTYEFEAAEGSVWSITGSTTSGDLDPVLRLFNTAGDLLAANDNEQRGSLDARIEGWIAPEDGVYQVEIAREGDLRAQTSGTAALTLYTGYSDLLSTPLEAESVNLAPGNFLNLATLDSGEPHVIVQFEANFSGNDSFWLQADSEGGDSWVMSFSADEWFMAVAPTVLPDDPNLTQVVTMSAGLYSVRLDEQSVEVWLNNGLLFAFTTEEVPLFFEDSSLISLTTPDSNDEAVTIQNPSVTRRFYDEEALASATAPTAPTDRLYSYDQDFFDVIAELNALSLLDTEGAMIMQIPRGTLETGNIGFGVYPLAMADGVENFVLSFVAEFRVTGVGAACGMTFRRVDGANFASVMLSEDGNAYLLEYQDGELTPESQAIATPTMLQGAQQRNYVTMIAQDEDIMLYVNGLRVTTTTFGSKIGIMQLSIVLNDPTYTLCLLDNIWVWSLDE